MSETFRALVMRETDGKPVAAIETLSDADLPDAQVTVAVSHSTLNYKDGMVVRGNIGRLVRRFPHVPGIDFAGQVLASEDARYKPGDAVVLTGWRVGEAWWGGYGERARVKADWLVPLPAGLTPARAMAVGTAGFTAMLAIDALEAQGLKPGVGPVLVTGASGGVGSVALMLLAALGYEAVASTGKADQAAYLTDLGAAAVIDRAELSEPGDKPLEAERWTGCIDSVGGTTLTRVLAQMRAGGSVAACGLAGGNALGGTVLPFLLRGVNLLGIDSVMQPHANRLRVWERLAGLIDAAKLDGLTETIGLADIPDRAARILNGAIKGRVVVDLAR